MENQQMAMPAEMAPAGPNPDEMAIYEQMRQQISPQEFSNEMLASASQIDPQAVAEFTEELQSLDVSPEELDALNDLVDEILANPEQYEELRQKYLAQGLPEDILPEQFDPNFFAAMNMAVDQMIAAPTGVQAFAEGGIAELKPIAKAIASYGRNGDTMLAHITPAEARMLRRRGGSGTINPHTGLPEFFLKKAFKSIGKAVKKFANSTVGRIVTTVALGFFLGPAAASLVGATSVAGVAAVSGFVGAAGSTLLGGGNLKDALKAGALGGLTAGAGAGIMGGSGAFQAGSYTGPTTIGGQFDKFKSAITPGAPSVPGAPAIAPTGEVAGQMPTDASNFGAPPDASGAAPVPRKLGINLNTGELVNPTGAPTGALPPIEAGPGYSPTNMAAANPSDFGAAKPSLFEQGKQFYSEKISPSGIRAGATPAAQAAGENAVSNLLQRVPTATPAMQEAAYQTAFKSAMPGIMGTYGPMAAVGLGSMAAFGGFDSKPVQGGDITKSLNTPVTQRIRESGTQRERYMQGLPGVVYDEYGAPVFGQSTRLPTYDVPDYNFGGFGMPGTGGQGIMNLPTTYIPPAGAVGSRAVAQPYNNANMYSNLLPRGYEDGGEVAPPPAAAATTTPPKKTPAELAAERQAMLDTMIAQQRAGRDKANQDRALRRAGGSGAMYANINAGLAALAPENNPMDVTDTGFGARNRAAQSAALQQQYAPMFQNQQNAMAEQARILGSKFTPFSPQASGSFPVPASTGPLTVGPAAQVPGTARPPIVTQPPITTRPPITTQPPVIQQAAGYTDQNIRDYLGSNPNMTDAQIRGAMDQFGVNPAQMASATGLPVAQVQQRYDAPSNFSNEAIQSYLAARPGLTDMQIRSAMDEFKVTPAQMAAATGVPMDQVQQRYNTARGQQFTNEVLAGAARPMNMGGIAGLAQGGYPRRTGQISGPGTEKSDDIPAMLSDGEFVMTAKAVRGAGKGSRRAGAKQMYKLMHQLEKNAERG
jgi:bacterioferritin-associated ferredoxin